MHKKNRKNLDCKVVVIGEEIGQLKAQSLSRMVQDYMKKPENQRGFEEWYLKKYGVPYGTVKK